MDFAVQTKMALASKNNPNCKGIMLLLFYPPPPIQIKHVGLKYFYLV